MLLMPRVRKIYINLLAVEKKRRRKQEERNIKKEVKLLNRQNELTQNELTQKHFGQVQPFLSCH